MNDRVTPLMVKAAWTVARQFWPSRVVELRPCKACNSVRRLVVAETCHKLEEPLPGFRETLVAALEAEANHGQ